MITKTEAIVQTIKSTGPYTLSNASDSACDNQEAIEFFENLVNEYVEALEDTATGELPDEDRRDEIAANAASIWDGERMMQVIGTKSYYDVSDLATGNEDILTLAGHVLYELAGRALTELHEIAQDAASDYDSDLFGVAEGMAAS